MAKRVIVESDLSGETDASTVAFAFDGKSYTVDLTDAEKEEFGKLLAKYIDVAEEAPTTTGQQAIPAQSTGPDPAKVRAWAQENGIEVNAKGRVPHSITAQYERAMAESES
ncbi:histone-like nucleoid-structuring protein Lsr2 [Streptomyces parvulus]|uniref:histone-like nucleoid-structuring protein Lsr2 n=1 Tax=Streptomyces parvulus TaxID=146923 RepID=UPI0036862BBE